MKIPLFQLDAFAAGLFRGNPAAVMVLEAFPADSTMQAIAAENNLSETAFLVRHEQDYLLRWFTPACEVPLCGHATLASAAVVMDRLEPGRKEVSFHTASGILSVQRTGTGFRMNFPANPVRKTEIPPNCEAALGAHPVEFWKNDRFALVLLKSAREVRELRPHMDLVATLDPHGVIVTAPGDEQYDFVSRFFAPAMGVAEDPVTGSAHCVLTPFWAERLEKNEFRAFQASVRGGELLCRLAADRVELEGQCVFYLEGTADLGSLVAEK